jgi:hypothetical protein
MLRRKREVIFSANIEYVHYQNQKERYISQDSRVGDNISFERLDSEVRNVLCHELPAELDKIYGIKADIRYISSRQGSLIVFFGAMVTTYGIIANYKDFFESVRLIEKDAERLLRLLARKLGIDVSIDVDREYPEDLPNPNNMDFGFRLKHPFHRFPPDIAEMVLETGAYGTYNHSKRDGFFWYLVIMNAILLVALGALVAAAVIKVYFSVAS